MNNSGRERRQFRKLTRENWRQFDDTWPFVWKKGDGSPDRLTPDDFAAMFLECELCEDVPDDVRNLFEVARGVMCYGGLFYPAYTVGHDQLYKVLEAAVSHRCEQLQAPNSLKRYNDKINWLYEREVLTGELLERWQSARAVRNMTSHVKRQWITSPDMALNSLSLVRFLIHSLFAQDAEDSS